MVPCHSTTTALPLRSEGNGRDGSIGDIAPRSAPVLLCSMHLVLLDGLSWKNAAHDSRRFFCRYGVHLLATLGDAACRPRQAC